MSRSSSVPKLRTYSKDMDKLPRITKNSWLTNTSKGSDNDYLRRKQKIPKKYTLMKGDFNNAMDNIDNNLNRKLNGKNPIIYDQLNNIENNYYEMKYMLNDKINRLEKNQKKVNDFLKYSLEQDRFQNDLNSYKFNKYIKNYRDKNLSEKEYLLNMLSKVPGLIENKIGKIYLNELEENRNQKQFLDNLKDRISLELQNQRRADYLRYKRQLNEVIQQKNHEEKEKLLLYHKIQEQKILNKMQAIKYQNQLYRYQAYNNYNYNIPYYQLMQAQINNLNNNNNNNKKDSLGLSMDELIKIFLFKELIGSSRMNDYQNMMNNYLLSPYMNPNINFPGNNFYPPYDNRYRRRSEDPYYRNRDRRHSRYKSKNSEYTKTFKSEVKKTTEKKSEKKSTKKTQKSKSNSSSSESSSDSSDESSSESKSKSKAKKKEKSKKASEEEKKSDSEDDKDESKDENTDEDNNEDNEDDDGNDNNDGGEDEGDVAGDGEGDGDGDDQGDVDGDGDGDAEGDAVGDGEGDIEGDGEGGEQNQNYNDGNPAQTSQQPQY